MNKEERNKYMKEYYKGNSERLKKKRELNKNGR